MEELQTEVYAGARPVDRQIACKLRGRELTSAAGRGTPKAKEEMRKILKDMRGV